jgi:probable addiction module antidote protein
MKTAYAAFDAAAYLDNDAVIAEYLSAAAEDPNPDVFLAALGDVAKARGMAQIAKHAGLGRESLYKALSAGAHPRFETVNAVLRALGVKFAVCWGTPQISVIFFRCVVNPPGLREQPGCRIRTGIRIGGSGALVPIVAGLFRWIAGSPSRLL